LIIDGEILQHGNRGNETKPHITNKIDNAPYWDLSQKEQALTREDQVVPNKGSRRLLLIFRSGLKFGNCPLTMGTISNNVHRLIKPGKNCSKREEIRMYYRGGEFDQNTLYVHMKTSK
jgi:hypothetical protein